MIKEEQDKDRRVLFPNDDLPADLAGVPMLPQEFVGKQNTGLGGGNKSSARQWTEDEVTWITKLRKEGYNVRQIAHSVGRTDISVSLKFKRLLKDRNRYNSDHLDEKYEYNDEFCELVKPATILDLYCGESSYWKNRHPEISVTTNDKNTAFEADTHEAAGMLCHKLLYERKSYDVIDLDPYGSAYECFECAVQMARKGLIVTYGEMGHLRFKRFDFVRSHYGISKLSEFSIEPMIRETVRIGLCHKKKLTPVRLLNWNRISRVYYTIDTIKTTEQWERRQGEQLNLQFKDEEFT